jgi:hypothetical protein
MPHSDVTQATCRSAIGCLSLRLSEAMERCSGHCCRRCHLQYASAMRGADHTCGGACAQSSMRNLMFRCPTTRLDVQGFIAEDMTAAKTVSVWFSMKCTACTRFHFVHPVTGRVLGSNDE